MTQRVGYMLAFAAYEAIQGQKGVNGDELAVSREVVSLERIQISDEMYQWALEAIEKAKTNPTKGMIDGLPDEFYAQSYVELRGVQDIPDQPEVQVMRIGEVGIVGIPGELFSELALEIKKQSPAEHTIVIEIANDHVGYLPIKEAFDQGGYEPSVGSTRYKAGAGEQLAASAIRQLKSLF